MEQLRLASRGVKKPVEEHQTTTGTKDKILQHWIPLILAKSKEVKAARRAKLRRDTGDKKATLTSDDMLEVEASVLKWAADLSSPLFSPLLTIDGK